MKKLLLSLVVALAMGCGISASQAQVLTFNLNFVSYGTETPPTNFTNLVTQNFNQNEAESWSIGSGLTLSFDAVNNYDTGNASNSLVAGGVFVDSAQTATFTLSGLAPGSTVTLWAIDAWDQSGRSGTVTFGGNTVSTATANDGPTTPGNSPTVSDFVQIASNVAVGGTGILTGTVTAGTNAQGQIGGFIIQVTPAAVPEPSTWAMLAAGGALFLALGYRRARC